MIRVFPYSLASIEFQGDGFDNPNRLFFSINKTMENTLSQKSDLREFIPEMFYFPDLFNNKNELKLGTVRNGEEMEEIDNVSVSDKNKSNYEKYEYLTKIKNYLEYDKLKLNEWINLIFGINQKTTKDKTKRKYFDNCMYIYLMKKIKKRLWIVL